MATWRLLRSHPTLFRSVRAHLVWNGFLGTCQRGVFKIIAGTHRLTNSERVPFASWTGRSPGGAGTDQDSWAYEIGQLRTQSDLLKFFNEHRELLLPVHLCMILERLAGGPAGVGAGRSNPRPVGDVRAAMTEARRSLFNSPDFIQLMKDIVLKLELLGPVHFPRMIASLNSLGFHDRQLFKVAEPLVIKFLPNMSPKDLVRVVVCYIEAHCGSRVFFDEFIRRGCEVIEELDSSSLVDLVVAFSQSPHKPRAFLNNVGPVVTFRLRDFNAQELGDLIRAYTRCSRDLPHGFLEKLSERLVGTVDSKSEQFNANLFEMMDPASIISVVRALQKIQRHGPPGRRAKHLALMLGAATSALAHAGVENLQPADVALAFAALARYPVAELAPPGLVKRLYQRVLGTSQDLPEATLAACLLGSARCLAGQVSDSGEPFDSATFSLSFPAAERASDTGSDATDAETPSQGLKMTGSVAAIENRLPCDRQLLDKSEARVQRIASNLEPRELTYVVLAYSMSHTGSPELFAVLQRACLEKCRQFPMEQMASLLWGMANIRMGPGLFKEAQFDILDRLSQLTVPSICDILWAYCVVKLHDPHLFQALLSTLVPSLIHDDSRCALLCPALLDIRFRLPELDPEGLERYLSYARSDFRRSQETFVAAPADARRSLADALASLRIDGSLIEEMADIDGYLVDVLVRPSVVKEANSIDMTEAPLALLYHSAPRTLHFRTSEPLGHTMLRQRHLQNRGLRVVNIWDKTWERLASASDRAAFLQDRIEAIAQTMAKEASSKPRI